MTAIEDRMKDDIKNTITTIKDTMGENIKNMIITIKEETSDTVEEDIKNTMIAIKEEISNATIAAFERLDKRMDEDANKISKLGQYVEKRDAVLEKMISTRIREEVAKLGRLPGPDIRPRAVEKNERDFDFCRRTLKIWPIRGKDLKNEVKNFLAKHLGFSDDKIESLGAVVTSKAPGRTASDKGEILAMFETKEDRDTVKAGAFNLSGKREVGMAVFVPSYLMNNLVALNSIGFRIKSRYAGVKRAIKFDDKGRDIFLDICISGKWKRITPDQAKTVMERVPVPGKSSEDLSLENLANLAQGKTVAGRTAVVLPEEEEEMWQPTARGNQRPRDVTVDTISVNTTKNNTGSLWPQVPSFVPCLLILSICLAKVTETWSTTGSMLELESKNLLPVNGLEIRCLNQEDFGVLPLEPVIIATSYALLLGTGTGGEYFSHKPFTDAGNKNWPSVNKSERNSPRWTELQDNLDIYPVSSQVRSRAFGTCEITMTAPRKATRACCIEIRKRPVISLNGFPSLDVYLCITRSQIVWVSCNQNINNHVYIVPSNENLMSFLSKRLIH